MKKYTLVLFLISLQFLFASEEVNKKAPLIRASTINGEIIDLNNLKGKVILLDFWASWCIPCRAEIPFLNELANKYDREKFEVITINLDLEISNMKSFLKKVIGNPSFTVIYDKEQKFPGLYEVDTMPSSFLIDKKGNIRFIYKGFTQEDKSTFEKEIKNLLEEK